MGKKVIIFTGGGSGGHVIPGITLIKDIQKKYLKSPNGQRLRQLWMSKYNTWHISDGYCINAPILPDNFPTLHNDIEKWDEWDATYDKWFFDFMSTNIMK